MLVKEFLDANPKTIEPGYVFSLLTKKTEEIYHGYVKKAADSLGLRCESFLDFNSPGDALRDILASIQKAEILVYDITDFTPNVMWELGLGLAIKDAERVIVIREANNTSLPFDIYSHRVSFQYSLNNEENLGKLFKTLKDEMQKINRASSRKAPIQSPEVKSLLDNALRAVDRKEWITAEALFQTMDAREPENWYIYNQWGIMHRSKGEFEAAGPRFNQAMTFTNFDDEKAFIYTELAVLNQMSRKYKEAEEWFKKAEKADSENNRLYIAWAEYHDELGDHFNAQAKINGALGRLRETDPEYKEFRLRHAYYDMKINDRAYRKNFEQFKRERGGRPGPPAPPSRPDGNGKLPYDIDLDEIVDNYIGKIVPGEINNVTELGIFVTLSKNFTGLIHWKYLKEGFGEHFARSQRINVKIVSAFFDQKAQRNKVDLRLVE